MRILCDALNLIEQQRENMLNRLSPHSIASNSFKRIIIVFYTAMSFWYNCRFTEYLLTCVWIARECDFGNFYWILSWIYVNWKLWIRISRMEIAQKKIVLENRGVFVKAINSLIDPIKETAFQLRLNEAALFKHFWSTSTVNSQRIVVRFAFCLSLHSLLKWSTTKDVTKDVDASEKNVRRRRKGSLWRIYFNLIEHIIVIN